MKRIFKKWIIKNIIKILKIYKDSLESDNLIFKTYLEQTIYFEIEYLIKLIKEER